MEDYDDILSDKSYNEEAYYSDQINSDIEAELYGLVHHDTQDNSISLQDESDSVEIKSVSLEDKSACIKNNSNLFQNSMGPTDDNSALVLPATSITAEDTINSAKKLKNTVKKSSQNYSSPIKNNTDFFCSDTIINNNLYMSFESPVRKKSIQNNLVQSKNSKSNAAERPAKRKSDVVSEILGNIQLKKNRNSKSIQSKDSASKRNENSRNNNSIISETDSFVEVVDSSSDSDSDSSIVFLEPDQSNLQTNIAKETVVLSSDSENSDSSIERSLSQACRKKQTTASNTDLNPTIKDPWHINSEDKFRTRKQSNRYHENAVITCSKCQLKGHSAKFCSIPKAVKCFFCGDNHAGSDCKNKICTKCFRLGHDRRLCYIHYIDTCELCRMRGHSERNCPDLWRRYHLTTSKGSIVKGNPNPHIPLYCYSCGSKGHYGAECMEIRTNRWYFPTWPSVISYKNPVSVLQREREKDFHERSKFDRTPLFHRRKRYETFSNDTPTHSKKKKKKKKSSKISPNGSHQSATRPKTSFQNEVYFPRTPKTPSSMTPSSSAVRPNKKKFKKFKSKEDRVTSQQMMHRIGLQQRLGLPFPSTI
ncbi:zinc finger CCHC domain-containing protein 7-like [Argiope bruennichi]|uniref:zinc finger CCHC domain-containing protein 7-like n=1 Tax=Argiope bruennichi TaxID=94029 RepID=UPI00249544D1|nr:zinc finger CCHC domain-containing protein 7-like [Argiope bruennichi]XP_055953868.1 zinc finger CCHC domain-containing protein 7-like [Argiope bruennichi]